MKTIKYRAWDIKEKAMYIPSELQFRSEGVFCYYGTLNSKEYDGKEYYDNRKLCNEYSGREQEAILMQFTGLLDKNGKEIYEGDIFQDEESGDCDFVEWNIAYSGWSTNIWFEPLELTEQASRIEVVGNIYENPELLTSPA